MSKNGKQPWINRIVGQGTEVPDQLLANPANFRIHPKNQQDALAGSLDSLGWIQQVLVNRQTGNMIDGHLRVQMALRNGEPSVPVLYVDLTEDEERQALLMLDPIASMAATDKQKLDELLRQVQSDDQRVTQMLSDLAEREGLEYGKEPKEDLGAQIDKAAELLEKWKVQLGDLYEIGQHKLICGDCTDRAVVERVMGGEKAVLMETDPPYGVDYGELVESRRNQKKGGWSDIENDALDDDALYTLLVNSLNGEGAKVGFVWHPPGARRWLFWNALQKNGWRITQEIVWVKNSLVFGRADYQWRHEPCMYAKREGAPRQDDRTQTTVWEVNKPTDSMHPTQKPLELFELPINNHTVPGDIIYDPFLGSGTTLCACERLGRKGRGVEISPTYCAVALERLSGMGLEPKRVE